jgi:hypothetical protein
MAQQWYYEIMGQKNGPISSVELLDLAQRGIILSYTPVANSPNGPWVLAENVKGLFPISGGTPRRMSEAISAQPPPPPLPTKMSAKPPPLPFPIRAGQDKTSTRTRFSPRSISLIVGGSLTVIMLIIAIILGTRSQNRERESADMPIVNAAKATKKTELILSNSSDVQSVHAAKSNFAKGSPEYVVEQYAKANSWRERLQYVKQTKGIQEKMSQHYGDQPTRFEYDKIQKTYTSEPNVGDVVTVDVIESGQNAFGNIVKETIPYYLEKTSQGYLILWEPSISWSPIGWNAYLASRPEEPITFPLLCTLDDTFYVTKENIKLTHFSLEVVPPKEFKKRYAFVLKESPAGKKMFETLKDGKQHMMLLTIQFRKNEDEDCVWISRLVSDKPWIYDETFANRFTSPIFVPKSQVQAESSEIPFEISDIVAQWTFSETTIRERLLVPEVRFRVTPKLQPIKSLRIKVIYLEKQLKSTEIMDEDINYVITGSDRPLEKGFSKLVISHSGKGYITLVPKSTVEKSDISAELYYDIGEGYLKFKTVSIEKKINY